MINKTIWQMIMPSVACSENGQKRADNELCRACLSKPEQALKFIGVTTTLATKFTKASTDVVAA